MLDAALHATAEKRGSDKLIGEYAEIVADIKGNAIMQQHWKNYQKDFGYASEITFAEACDAVMAVMSRLGEQKGVKGDITP